MFEWRAWCTRLNRNLALPLLQMSEWVMADNSMSSAPSSKGKQHCFQAVFIGLEQGQEMQNRERDSRAWQAWEQEEASLPCLLE